MESEEKGPVGNSDIVYDKSEAGERGLTIKKKGGSRKNQR